MKTGPLGVLESKSHSSKSGTSIYYASRELNLIMKESYYHCKASSSSDFTLPELEHNYCEITFLIDNSSIALGNSLHKTL